MRMRKKPNLVPRLERCSRVLLSDPAENFGRWREAFPTAETLWLEIGCGKGRFTAQTAKENPNALIIAIEKVPEALTVAMERACADDIPNVRFICSDALALPVIFAENELDRIFINFCDPWKKSRDAKRRLTHPAFLQIYESILKPEGEIHFKTDNIALFEYSMEMFTEEGWALSEVTYDLHRDAIAGVMTDYEVKFYEQGLAINRLVAKATGVALRKDTK